VHEQELIKFISPDKIFPIELTYKKSIAFSTQNKQNKSTGLRVRNRAARPEAEPGAPEPTIFGEAGAAFNI